MKMTKLIDLNYLKEIMDGKKELILGMIDTFLSQLPEELLGINNAVRKSEYSVIKKLAHTMISSVSIMGVSILVPVLKEMEELGSQALDMAKINELNLKLNFLSQQVIEEIKSERLNYL